VAFLIEDREAQLWSYLTERQRIWDRRERGLPWPWTLDNVLRDWQFPNVYRELDLGTKYLREELLPKLGVGQLLLNMVAYRHFNTILAAERLLPLDGPLPNDIKKILCGIQPYTQAYRTSPFVHLGANTPMENSIIASHSWAEFCPKMEPCLGGEPMREVYNAIKSLPGIGPFVGYVIACDLTYTDLVDYTEDSDVYPGSGSVECLQWMTGRSWVNRTDAKFLINQLHRKARERLTAWGFPFYEDRDLSLRAIEDGLCELHRYRAIKAGSTAARRYYPQLLPL
jgi:alpha-glutamyl/putrescinyl thymine pyrophosphorylase clade 1